MIRAGERPLYLLHQKRPVYTTLTYELKIGHLVNQSREFLIRKVAARHSDSTGYAVADPGPAHIVQTRVRNFDISFTLRSQHSAPATYSVRQRTIGAI